MDDPDTLKEKVSDFTSLRAKSVQLTNVISNLTFLKMQSGSTSPGSARTKALRCLPAARCVPLGNTKILKVKFPTVKDDGEHTLRVGEMDHGLSNMNSISPDLTSGHVAGSVFGSETMSDLMNIG